MNLTAKTIAQALQTRLALITTANGYLTDIGLRVYRGKLLLDPSEAPCTVIREGADSVPEQTRTKARLHQRYALEGHDICDPDNPNDKAHDIIRDLKRCVFSAPIADAVRKVEYRGRLIGVREDGLAFVSASVEIDIEFAEELTDP